MKKKRWIFYTIMAILGTVMLTVTAAAVYYTYITDRTLHEVTSPEPSGILFSVYVLKEDPAQTLEEARGYRFGVSRHDIDQEKMEFIYTE
ncbi:MAG: hypothetical protein ACOX8H_10165 [Ruminococcus sp.]|jgi:cellulose synthase/poly-beta-1,6-N-acetylglucosamine synthase-like glycosyltransferase